MSSAMGALIQPILPQQTPAVEVLLRQLAQSMTPTLDALINQLIPLNTTSGGNKGGNTSSEINNTGVNNTGINNTAIKSGIIEAIVLSSSKLLDSGKATNTQPQFKINVNTGKQSFELTTNTPIPAGTRIRLNIVKQNLATILAINSGNTQLTTKSTGEITARINNSGTPPNPKTAQPPAQPLLKQSIIDQGLRTALPQQQSLKLLLPLLQQISQQPPQHWPKALTNNLQVLLGQFPNSDQAQQPQQLKQSMQNSGVFFEAKLAQLLTQKNAAAQQPTAKQTLNTDNQIKGDIKGLMQRLISQITKIDSATPQPASNLTTAATTETNKPMPLSYSALQDLKPAGHDLLINHNSHTSSANKEPATDVLLRQLSQQLLSSLARSQVNQLESLAVRQSNNPDSQAPVNSWALEIPILHGKQADNLELRINQYELEDPQTKAPAATKKIWTVMLAFDLHSSGKMNVELKILDQTVSATVWSEQEKTYQQVRQQVAQLKNNLEKVGVQVKQVECQLGLPPKKTTPIFQQLVDIRT